MPQTLSPGLKKLLREPAYCQLATLMPDGSPQNTQVWVDTDGEHILVNTAEGRQKVKNVRRDPRVALNVVDPRTPGASPASGAESWMLRPKAQTGSSTNWQRSTSTRTLIRFGNPGRYV